jgi:hypothetical protein
MAVPYSCPRGGRSDPGAPQHLALVRSLRRPGHPGPSGSSRTSRAGCRTTPTAAPIRGTSRFAWVSRPFRSGPRRAEGAKCIPMSLLRLSAGEATGSRSTPAGGLTRFIRDYFDTIAGPKTAPESYARIATALDRSPSLESRPGSCRKRGLRMSRLGPSPYRAEIPL